MVGMNDLVLAHYILQKTVIAAKIAGVPVGLLGFMDEMSNTCIQYPSNLVTC